MVSSPSPLLEKSLFLGFIISIVQGWHVVSLELESIKSKQPLSNNTWFPQNKRHPPPSSFTSWDLREPAEAERGPGMRRPERPFWSCDVILAKSENLKPLKLKQNPQAERLSAFKMNCPRGHPHGGPTTTPRFGAILFQLKLPLSSSCSRQHTTSLSL